MNTTHGGTGWETLTFDTSTGTINGTPSAVAVVVVTPRITNVEANAVNPSTDEVYYFDNLEVDGGSGGSELKLPINFDDAIDYVSKSSTEPGTVFSVVENPQQEGIHDISTKVGQIVNGGAAFDNVKFAMDQTIDLSTLKSIKLKLYSEQSLPVLLKLENSQTDAVEKQLTHAGNGWEELIFDFNSSASFSNIVLFVAFNQSVTGTFYVDDIVQVESPPKNLPTLPVAFESEDFDYEFGQFEGSPSERIDNPVSGTGNTSPKVVKTTKNQDAAVFAGTFFSLAEPIDFSTGSKISLNLYSPKSGIKIKMKLENAADAGINQETVTVNNVADAWETLEFDFSNLVTTEELSKVILIFDDEVVGDGSEYYWDDVTLIGDPIVPPAFPVDFESTAFTYNFLDFEGQGSAVITNPDPNGDNTSATVVQTNKGAGAATFAGTVIGFNAPIDFTEGKVLSLKTWSPKVGAKVNLKLENRDDATIGAELAAVTTVANTWETLTFDFAGQIEGKSLSKAIVFFDFEQPGGDTETTYYWDELQIRPIPDEENATLDNILIGGVPIAVFDPEVLEYAVILPENDQSIPVISEVKAFAGATAVVTQANNLAEKATIEVTSEDGNTTLTYEVGFTVLTATNNLIVNGDFEAGGSWTGNAFNIQSEGGNQFNFADVESAGAASNVNLSQGLNIAQDKTYFLTFDASTSTGATRTILAGIGLNEGNFANNSKEVTLTDQNQTFTLILPAGGFGSANSRVLFDMGADVGVVVIDNVSLIERIVPPVLPTAAPTEPVFDLADVVSVYSDTYGERSGAVFNDQGSAAFDRIDLGGNEVLRYTASSSSDFSLIELGAGNSVDMLEEGMSNLRFDLWFSNEVTPSSSLIFKVVNLGSPVSEAEIIIRDSFDPSMQQGEWITFDFSIADLTDLGMDGFRDIRQFVLVVGNTPDVYMDNLMFYKAPIDPISDASLSDLTVGGTTVEGFNTLLLGYNVELAFGATVPTVIATTTNANANAVVSPAPQLPGATTVSVTAEDGTTQSTYTIDFILVDPPTAGPNAPDDDAADVFSVFSDSYDDVPKVGFAEIGGAEFENVDLGGNEVLRYAIGDNNFSIIDMGESNKIDLAARSITNFKFDVWFSKSLEAGSNLLLKINDGTVSNEAIFTIDATSSPAITQGQWLTYDFKLSELGLAANTNVQQIVIDILNVGEAYFDNMYFYNGGDQPVTNLLTNGDFQDDATGWNTNYGGPEIQEASGNKFFFANIAEAAANPYDVNMDQILNLTQGESYILSFDASAGAGQTRSLQVGIGQNFDPFTSVTEDVNLPSPGPNGELQAFSVELTADFDVGASNRVFFNLGGDAGVVVIDNVSLVPDTGGPSDDATLSDLKVADVSIETFDVAMPDYQFVLPFGTPALPLVSATTTDNDATLDITQASTATDSIATVLVTAEDGITTKSYTVDFSIAPPAQDASLSSILLNDNALDGFVETDLEYEVILPSGATVGDIPTVTATTNDENASYEVTEAATTLPGTTTIVVTAEDVEITQTYTLDFRVAGVTEDASLSDLQVGGQTLETFEPVKLEYDSILPFGTEVVPTVVGIPTIAEAVVLVTPADDLPGSTTVLVTSTGGEEKATYTINFTIGDPGTDATLSGITYNGIAVPGFDAATDSYSVALAAGTTAIPTVVGTPTDDNATVVVTDAGALPGVTTIVVTAEDGTTKGTYTLGFTVEGDDNLLTNGNFESGTSGWATNYGDNLPEIQTTEGNSFFFYNNTGATPNPGSAFEQNLGQVLDLESGQSYVLSFDASSGDNQTRTIEVGFGQNFGSFNSVTQLINLPSAGANGELTSFNVLLRDSSFYDFSANSRVFFNLFGDAGVVVIDNVSLVPAESASYPITFEQNDVGYRFSDVDGAPSDVVANPNRTGINTSQNVALTKMTGSALTAVTILNLDDPIDFSAGKTVFMKTYVPKAGIKVRLRFENATDVDVGAELTVTTTAVEAWEELSFDFNDLIDDNISLSKMIMRFDVDNPGDGSSYYWDDVSLISPRADATLSSILVDDEPIEDFSSSILNWEVEIPFGTTVIPTVAATANSVGADVVITQAPDLLDSAEIVVTSIDQANTNTYYVKFKVGEASDDPTLTDIKVDGLSIAGFRSDSLVYTIELPSGTTVIPQITEAIVSNDSATVVITQATQIPDTARVVVTAQSDSVLTYKVAFKLLDANKDATLSEITYGLDNIPVPGFNPLDTAYEVQLPFGSAVPTVAAVASNEENADVDITQITELPGRVTIVVTAADGETKKTYTIDFSAPNTDASLSDLRLGDETIEGFLPEELVYKVTLPFSAQIIPATTATATDVDGATVDIEIALTPEDSTFVVVTAEDGTTVNKYIIAFEVAPAGTDATLKELLVDGNKVADFIPSELTYTIVLSEGASGVPVIDAVPTDENAVLVITQAASLEDAAVVLITAEDGVTISEYRVIFEVSDNKAPVVTNRILDQSINLDKTITFILSDHFSDPEGLLLTYSFDNLRDEVVTVSITEGVLSVSGITEGTSNIQVAATDDINGTATLDFDITVVAEGVEIARDIAGKVTADGDPFTQGRAVMFDVNNINNAFSSNLTEAGGFAFSFVPEGSYYLYVTSTSPDYVTTVYGDVSTVLDANATVQTLEVTSSMTGLQISMVDKPTPAITFLDKETGGTLNFNTRSVTGSGSRVLEGNSTEGDVLPGVIVILQTLQGEYIADGVTDESGHIQFIGLPTGSYNLVVDVPGVGRVISEIAVEEGKQAYYTGLIDEDGIAVNIATGIDDDLLKAILLYPTKAERELYIDLPAPILQQFELRITSMSGRQIIPNFEIENSRIMIQVDQLSAGLHIVMISTQDGTWSGKFIKQ
ncbi:MAG: carbohydrate binding domain-containing protein [Cyclobacteriaceae bacterium]